MPNAIRAGFVSLPAIFLNEGASTLTHTHQSFASQCVFFSYTRFLAKWRLLILAYATPSKIFDVYSVVKRQISPDTELEWPRAFQEIKVPRFHDNGTGRW